MWRRFSRSELLSTFFPTWIWQGRMWAKGKVPKHDGHFWIVADAHPVLATYYPPNIVTSLCSAFLSIDKSFILLVLNLLIHISLQFAGWFILCSQFAGNLVALFGAITLTFSAYNWKQQPCFLYTVAWFPWLLTGIATNNILLTSLAFGMILLAGYYPIGIQATLIAVCASVLWDTPLTWVPIGILIGSPQLIPFLKYLPKTIRTKKVSSIGKVPWWHPITLIFPTRTSYNGVGYWEMAYYVGIVPIVLLASSTSRVWALAVVSYFLMIGLFSEKLPRIPARWCWSFQFAIGWMAVNGLSNLHLTERALACLCVVQAFDLIWRNADLIPTLPYSELYQRPSRAFSSPLTRFLEANLGDCRVSGLPYPIFTGHINKLKTLGYSGGMQLKLMAKFRNDNNPDGNGSHDWFKDNENDERLTSYRVRFSHSRKRINNWLSTEVRRLYRNPEL